MEVVVYRFGHRIARDKRITTHVALVARAFGAKGIIIDTKDEKIETTIKKVKEKFGNDFFIKSGIRWQQFFKEWNGSIIHLTMYGEKIDKVIEKIKKENKIAVVVGSEKVPSEFYKIADYNVSIGNQPHSEVAALAIFLHFLLDAAWLKKNFNGIFKIIPAAREKKVEYDYLKILQNEGCDESVIKHCIKVTKLAMAIAERIRKNGIKVDLQAVEAGAMLHDVGRAKTHGIMHIVEGEKIAKKYGLPEKIIKIIEHHGGAGIDENDAIELGLPKKDYSPHSIEEKIVAHADNLVGNGYRSVEEVANMWKKKIGGKAVKKLMDLHNELSELAGIDINGISNLLKKQMK